MMPGSCPNCGSEIPAALQRIADAINEQEVQVVLDAPDNVLEILSRIERSLAEIASKVGR